MNLLLEAFGIFCLTYIIAYVSWNLIVKFAKVKDEKH